MNINGTLSITKQYGHDNCVVITIRDQESRHVVKIPVERFGHVLMGMAEEPCNVVTSTGKFHAAPKAD